MALGITLFQVSRIQEKTTAPSCAVLRDFAAWAKLRKLSALTSSELDRQGAEYLDHLFFGGYQAERGEKLLAALQALHPELGTAATGSLPLMRAGMRGFRKLAHGYSRTPLVLEAVHAIIGQLAATQRLDMVRAILVSWDAFLRLPSDLVRMTGASWVAPVSGLAGNRWGSCCIRKSRTHDRRRHSSTKA